MSKHLWLVTSFTPETVEKGVRTLRKYRKSFPSWKAAVTFVGYAIEQGRQTGFSKPSFEGGFHVRDAITKSFEGGVNSGHRYAKGRNGENYWLAGRRILCRALRDLGTDSWGEDLKTLYTALYDGEDVSGPLHDLLEERGFAAQAALLA